MPKQCKNIREVVNLLDQEKKTLQETTRDRVTEISIEDVRHETTRTEGDSAYPRVTRQTSERRNEKIVWRASGIVIGSPIGSALEESSKTVTADILEGEEDTQIQFGHRTPEVKRSIASGPPKEPLPGRLVNRLNEWKKIWGDKRVSRGEKTQTRVSGDDRDDEQLFIPLGGGVEGLSGEAHTEFGGEVVQPDIHGDKEKRKVEEDPGLQSSKRGSAGKTLQNGFPGNSGGTPGGERLDDHFGYIECIPACKGGRAIQSLSVLQLSKSMLFLRNDAIWSKVRAQSIREDNETSSLVHQRTVESEASNISGRHSPHASRQECIEIDLTGGGPVPERSGLDTVGGEAEIGTHNEWGVFGMAVEFREDGSDAPREEESVAPGGCANLDNICKEKEETKDERLRSTYLEAELCEAATPTSELVDDAHAMARRGWNGTVIVNPMLFGELTFWKKILQENRPRSLRGRARPAELITDESELGWGAALTISTESREEKIYVHGSWTLQESTLAINEKESRAVLRTLERKGAWLQQQKIDHIRLKTDDMSTRWTIQKKRGAPSLIPTLRASEKKLISLDMTIQTEHLPGEQNTEADALSRMARKWQRYCKLSHLEH
ncbi:uncharacterized protein MONOS_9877 [Monocercomonoides exilis]|uniref:uncharacterized protein n=1 Tax=Monocercomonoides exilis TaxID=2049356 RepID=UPI003559AAEC|nr:hypothetical protein MONOS_9877 [Monocercomonoides exilis]|eukprot:MONOS_9877.1-p1 / transcript=MONOS_9877.1 / gene=MONOS_9877 / organism=Monocercomonoides_exilis_PA203 / gene_product=unspecified product / transcript_product=unspecified product / location=Mono_scaffold00424:17654-19524(-) / protein_length=608 / sequence_SO=supercontig / SO=protein_coding / is_pseudo=false